MDDDTRMYDQPGGADRQRYLMILDDAIEWARRGYHRMAMEHVQGPNKRQALKDYPRFLPEIEA